MDKKVELFLKELSELSLKHRIYIDGCGCCGSPFLMDDTKGVMDDLKWDEDKKMYVEDK